MNRCKKRLIRRPLMAVCALALAAALSSCAPGPNQLAGTANDKGKVAGFPQGVWHGVIAPVTFIVSLFNENVGVYESRNNGGWYDFGFILGLSITFGGGAGGARSKRRKG
jgi:hypothetical protein